MVAQNSEDKTGGWGVGYYKTAKKDVKIPEGVTAFSKSAPKQFYNKKQPLVPDNVGIIPPPAGFIDQWGYYTSHPTTKILPTTPFNNILKGDPSKQFEAPAPDPVNHAKDMLPDVVGMSNVSSKVNPMLIFIKSLLDYSNLPLKTSTQLKSVYFELSKLVFISNKRELSVTENKQLNEYTKIVEELSTMPGLKTEPQPQQPQQPIMQVPFDSDSIFEVPSSNQGKPIFPETPIKPEDTIDWSLFSPDDLISATLHGAQPDSDKNLLPDISKFDSDEDEDEEDKPIESKAERELPNSISSSEFQTVYDTEQEQWDLMKKLYASAQKTGLARTGKKSKYTQNRMFIKNELGNRISQSTVIAELLRGDKVLNIDTLTLDDERGF